MWQSKKLDQTDLQQIQNSLSEKMREDRQAILEAISQISQIQRENGNRIGRLEDLFARELQKVYNSLDTAPLQQQIGQIQTQVNDIFVLTSQRSTHRPDGTIKPVHDLIKARIQAVTDAMNTLEIEHAQWLEEQRQSLQETRKTLQDTQKAFDLVQERLETSVGHISPPQ